MKRTGFMTLVTVAALAGAPAWAQNTAQPAAQQPAPEKPSVGTATINPTGIPPSQRNPLLTDNGDVRIGKMIGTSIYNKDDKKLGSVDDVLAGQNGQLQVIVSASNKKVAVPWDKVQFGDAKLNSDNKILMPDESQQSLSSMPAFSYEGQKH
jgi:hypothetical protein